MPEDVELTLFDRGTPAREVGDSDAEAGSDVSTERTAMGSEPTEPSSLPRRFVTKLVLSAAVGGLMAWFVERGGVPLVPSAASLSLVDWNLFAVSVLLAVLAMWFRAVRWRVLIAPVARVPLRDVLLVNWAGFLAIFALPLRLGEFARPSPSPLPRRDPLVLARRCPHGDHDFRSTPVAGWAVKRGPLGSPKGTDGCLREDTTAGSV